MTSETEIEMETMNEQNAYFLDENGQFRIQTPTIESVSSPSTRPRSPVDESVSVSELQNISFQSTSSADLNTSGSECDHLSSSQLIKIIAARDEAWEQQTMAWRDKIKEKGHELESAKQRIKQLEEEISSEQFKKRQFFGVVLMWLFLIGSGLLLGSVAHYFAPGKKAAAVIKSSENLNLQNKLGP